MSESNTASSWTVQLGFGAGLLPPQLGRSPRLMFTEDRSTGEGQEATPQREPQREQLVLLWEDMGHRGSHLHRKVQLLSLNMA